MSATEAIPRSPQVTLDAPVASVIEARDGKSIVAIVEELKEKAIKNCSEAICCLTASCRTIPGENMFTYNPNEQEYILAHGPDLITVTLTDEKLGNCANKVHFVETVASIRSALTL